MNLPSRLFDALVTRELTKERQWPSRLRLWTYVAAMGLMLLCIFGVQVISQPWNLLPTILLALFAGAGCTAMANRMLAYRRGWSDGRQQLRKELRQVRRDGHDPLDYLEWTAVRDGVLLHGHDLPPYEPMTRERWEAIIRGEDPDNDR